MNNENVIEWLTGQDRITVSLTQRKYITRVKNLASSYPNEVDFLENTDGSIIAHLPLKALKLSIISTSNRDYSKAAERLKRYRDEHNE